MSGTRGRLTRAQIAAAALELIDELGAEQLTMRRLGQRLGVDPMAVYYHFPNKAAVLDAVTELVWSGVRFPATRPDERWSDVLFDLFMVVRARLLEHPGAIGTVGTRPLTTPAMLDLIDTTLARIAAAGLPEAEAMPLVDDLTAYTIGKLLGEVSILDGDAAQRVRQAIATISPTSHPALSRILAGGYQLSPEEGFIRGLRALIDGWTAAIGRQ